MKALAALAALSAVAQNLPPPTASQLRDAEKVYQFHCAFCHGKGDDGFAGNLVSPRLPHAPTDSSLLNIIRNGIPGTDMPPAYGMTDAEVRLVAQYVRALGRRAVEKVSGDPRRGEQIYAGKGTCATCHMVRGQGGRQGPDLTEIGARRGAAHLRASLVDPDAAITPGFTVVTATLVSGKQISGIRMNESTFSLHLRDNDGRIHNLRRSEIKQVAKDAAKSSMPAYKGFAPQEIDDLVAYLLSLRGGS